MRKGIFICVLCILLIILETLIVHAASPVVTLLSPADGAVDEDGTITFEYSVSDDLNNITQCELWTNLTGTWAITETDTTIAIGTNNFTRTGIADKSSFIWNVRCTDNETNSVFAAANRTAKVSYPKLIMYDLKAYVNGQKHSGIDEDCVDNVCDIDDDVYPGSEIKIVMQLKNNYDKDTDNIKIENIEIEGVLKEIDDGDDIEESADIDRIKAEYKETVELVFKIPLIVEEGNYDLAINIDAEDEYGNDQGFDFEFNVEVNKRTHDVIIKNAELLKDTLSCTRNTQLEVELLNIGVRDEDDVEILVKNTALGLNIRKTNIPELEADIDGDNEYEASFDISVDKGIEAGTYPISVTVFYSGNVHSDEKDVVLTIDDCQQQQQIPLANTTTQKTEDTTKSAEDKGNANFNATIPDYILQDFGITESVETSFKDSTAYIVLLVVGIVAAVGSISLLVVLLLRR